MTADTSTSPSQEGSDYFRHYLNRTIMLLGEEAVQTLRGKCVAIAGCGGQGGAACLTLARMGVSKFVLADPKPFDEPDINRQWGATLSTLGRNKAEVYADMLREINPSIKARLFTGGITEDNIDEFLHDADLLIDCLDISVPGFLRKRVFHSANDRGIHIFTGAMLGFGGMVAGSYPGGVPLAFVAGVEDTAIGGATLPKGLRDLFVPDHIDRLEKSLSIHRAPSIAVSPGVLSMVLAVEAALALLGNSIPGWRPPVCLPRVLFVDLLAMTFRVVELDDLLLGRSLLESRDREPEKPSSEVPAFQVESMSETTRASILKSVSYNTNLLPSDAVELDLATDSWSELHSPIPNVSDTRIDWTDSSTEQPIHGLYGYSYIVPVGRGRLAESLLCKALAHDPGVVLTNALFPTTRFHLESNGFSTVDIGVAAATLPTADIPFKGDIDIDVLKQRLDGGSEVKAIYLELCNNAGGGHPVSMGCLRSIRELASANGILVLLDTTRAFENAALIRKREAGYENRSLVSIVREMCSLSDACAASCSKDFPSRTGGFIGTNSLALFQSTSDLTLAFGDGLDGNGRLSMRSALSVDPESQTGALGRVLFVESVWKVLSSHGVPLVRPSGGHGLFIDAGAVYPHIRPDQFPAQVLVNELFTISGLRGAINFSTPEFRKKDFSLVRLAIPVNYCSTEHSSLIVECLSKVMARNTSAIGLMRSGGPNGAMAEFASEFKPVR